ncbi:hypothetical protein GGX14DRAFT_676690 [Mycena pura]|uniref:Uncharacterized protein n=1 Tax=Mycena pura TaxID=153505 RepID=A0AAD6Y0N1_9AGAR|nr:hypothetical protein GGX14DRAFT_676690 [Mycena pura]
MLPAPSSSTARSRGRIQPKFWDPTLQVTQVLLKPAITSPLIFPSLPVVLASRKLRARNCAGCRPLLHDPATHYTPSDCKALSRARETDHKLVERLSPKTVLLCKRIRKHIEGVEARKEDNGAELVNRAEMEKTLNEINGASAASGTHAHHRVHPCPTTCRPTARPADCTPSDRTTRRRCSPHAPCCKPSDCKTCRLLLAGCHPLLHTSRYTPSDCMARLNHTGEPRRTSRWRPSLRAVYLITTAHSVAAT